MTPAAVSYKASGVALIPTWSSANASVLSNSSNLASSLVTTFLVLKPNVLRQGGQYVFTASFSSSVKAQVIE